MSVLPDAAARQRATTEHRAHLAVEAGAGTGKTTLLVRRLIDGIVRGELEIHRFAAITFTELAAAELQVRLREGLEQALNRPDELDIVLDDTVRSRLDQALAGAATARISTIHAFCARLLREHPVAAGVDPEFTIVNEGFSGSLAESSWDDWLREQLESPERCQPLLDILAIGGSLDHVRSVAAALLEHPEATVAGLTDELSADELLATLVREHQQLLDHARSMLVSPDRDDLLIQRIEKLSLLWDELELLPPEMLVQRLIQLKKLPINPNCGRKANYGPGCLESLKEAIKDWRERRLTVTLRRHTTARILRLVEWLAHSTEYHRARIQREARLEFHDLLLKTHSLLSSSPETLAQLRTDFTTILVDEFQDTDPLQAEIVRLLTAGDGPPYRFIVGDPKQSIYRFRRADVESYAEVAGELAAAGQLVRITTNFRSRPKLLSVLNAALRELFVATAHEPVTEQVYQAPWTELEAPPSRPDSEDAALALLKPAATEQAPRRRDALAAEAAAVAAALCHVVRGGRRQLTDRDGQQRRVCWSDCAILMPATTQVEVLEEALEAHAIPYLQERSRSYYHRPEIGELLHVLSAVADPYDETAVVAALRSRFIGVDDTLLSRHRAAGGTFTPSTDSGEATVDEAIAQLVRWHHTSRVRPLPETLEQILGETRLGCLLAVTPRGDRAAENVHKLVALAQQFWNERIGDLNTFVSWLHSSVHSMVHEREASGSGTADRVTVLTMHGAKGLQWPVVALWDLNHRERTSAATTLLHRSGQLEIRCTDRVVTPGWEAGSTAERAHHRAERARLLYVAATRAEELLILPIQPPADTSSSSSSQTPYDLLLTSGTLSSWIEAAHSGELQQLAPGVVVWSVRELLQRHPEVPTQTGGVPLESVDHAARECAAARRAHWIRQRQELLQRAAGHRVVSPSELHHEAPSGVRPTHVPRTRSAAMRLGTAVHRALEALLADGRSSLDSAVAIAAGATDLEAELRGELDRMVRSAWSSDLIHRARAASQLWPELPVVWHTTAGAHPALAPLGAANQPVLVEGTADLVFSEDGQLWIVDFKTDAFADDRDLDRLVGRYTPQLDVYRAAFDAASGRRDSRAVLLFIATDPPRAVEITPR